MWDKDYMHPLDSGHKAIADTVVYLIQQTALQLAASPWGVADPDVIQEPMPTPMFKVCVHLLATLDLFVHSLFWKQRPIFC